MASKKIKSTRAYKDIKNLNARVDRLFTVNEPSSAFKAVADKQKAEYIDALRESGLSYKWVQKNGVSIPVIQNTAENRAKRNKLSQVKKANKLTLQQLKTYYTNNPDKLKELKAMQDLEQNIEFIYNNIGELPENIKTTLQSKKYRGKAPQWVANQLAQLVKEERLNQKKFALKYVNKPPKSQKIKNTRTK